MFIVCKMKDGRWDPVERLDSLDDARNHKKNLLKAGLESEILVRLKEGYYVVQDDGNSVQISHRQVA